MSRDIGANPGKPFGVAIIVAVALLFVASIAARGFFLAMRRAPNENISRER